MGLTAEPLERGRVGGEFLLQELQRHRPPQFRIARGIDHPHAARSQPRHNPVSAKRLTGRQFQRTRSQLLGRYLHRRCFHELFGPLGVREQFFHFPAQRFLAAACLPQPGAARSRLPLQRRMKELLDLSLAFKVHRLCSRQAHAVTTPSPFSTRASRCRETLAARAPFPLRSIRRRSAAPQPVPCADLRSPPR